MATIAVWIKVEEERVVQSLQETGERLDGVDGEVTLDFSAVHRIDPSSLGAMAELASIADDKGIKVVLRGVNIEIYRVLKLLKLASRFSFGN
jgi:anti-anti-sigma regulatory factor